MLALLLGCRARDPEQKSEPAIAANASARIAQAEARGQVRAFDPWLRTALADPVAEVRHAAARALGGIDAPEANAALASALGSSDVELVRLAAQGLSVSFRSLGKEECDVLAVALVRLPDETAVTPPLARALGGCSSELAEPILRNLLASHEDAVVPALARLARSRKNLQTATMTALVTRALASSAPACLEPLGRVPWPEELIPRVLAAALPASVTTARLYGQLGGRGDPALTAMAAAKEPNLEARAARFEALRALAKHGTEAPIARELEGLKPEGDPVAWANGPRGAELVQVLGTAPEVAKSTELRAVLTELAALPGASPRLDQLRCQAAARVAGSAFDSALLIHCAAEGSLQFELARLAALVRSPLRGGRQPHFEALLRSASLRVREAAVSALATHAEALAQPWGLAAVNRALSSDQPGEVIAALEVVSKLPETADPAGYAVAAKRTWSADSAELFEALLTTGRARRLPAALDLAASLVCNAAQPVRRSARQLLNDPPACARLEGVLPVAPSVGPVRLTLHTLAGALVLHLDPKAAPVSVAAIVKLARSGFYDHVEMHRVVPGFVVQFGDPGADGYGGAGGLLPHETSDNAFLPLRIGIAHAGYDTGSSQLFVTTGPARHLDGDYTWLGIAEGPWGDVVPGDVVTKVEIAEE